MENHFLKFRTGIIGINSKISTTYHEEIPLIYADWTASGRMYFPIEQRLSEEFYPYVANTHTDTNYTGSMMTYAYHKAQEKIKQHVGAGKDDVLISSCAGMTGVINKFQRILGLKIHEKYRSTIDIQASDRPIVFITHMEHHSNQTSWLETIADVIVVEPDEEGLVSVENFRKIIQQYQHRKVKIASITSCSNVTGIMTPYLEIAELIHEFDGYCFVDFACSAPYINIDMHHNDEKHQYLDAIFFSPHKFLGGPGATGVLVFNRNLYNNTIPDHPGGGTVEWTNPWGEHKYIESIEAREDGGTPPFLQTIKTAFSIQLKEEMNVDKIHQRETEMLSMIWKELKDIPNLHILADQHKNRLGVFSFYIPDLHFNLGVKILNDRFGIQTRGGCSCAGTYGHYLLNVDKNQSKRITNKIDKGDNSEKPGWIRLSLHPTHTNQELLFMTNAIKELAIKHHEWSKSYLMDEQCGSIKHLQNNTAQNLKNTVDKLFDKSLTT
ncbi:aminotransferase class V-fold PLP-dependent enzyme [Brumimicrobium aurantiacum]|uniref:Aminotransferase class V-fold PLP-dependent enzyme n=1 Tax=Brumimicrobium aurantiacum TaxID=1737063 RepID=A0A3E1EV96_9FLAO|nr:aminotransferase class V-fold PLP-dependent enzyme [Brumimicrobium aurantiacum]RFC53403.1 aminotransferase class V-fold PLP-dependent enzyme [Brumimicrobium aurantiacum]